MPVDVREGSITMDFAQRVVAAISFADYHYYEDLAAAATYTPPASIFATLGAESAFFAFFIHIELWDGGGWVDGHPVAAREFTCSVHQDNAQSLRIANAAGVAYKISLSGVVWTGLADYKHYEDLAGGGATYTPTAQTLASFFSEYAGFHVDNIHIEFWDGAFWVNTGQASLVGASCSIYQDTAQSLRIANAAGVAYKIMVTGGTWS